ncbi:MAG TPA: hypothetical protein VGL44_09020 [Gaiellales bacterium]|jgi:hypothetical protein
MTGRLALVGAALVLLAAAPAAHAAWSGAGAGTATAAASATPVQPVTIAAGTAAADPLYPTGTPVGDVAAAITNPNPYRVHVASLVLDSASGADGFSANAATCGLSFVPATAGWDIAAGATVQVDLQGSLAMATSAPAACQGLAVVVHLRAAP